MVIKINAIETATLLAHVAVQERFISLIGDKADREYATEREYSDNEQNYFNGMYDFYFELLTNGEVTIDHKVAHQSAKYTMEVSQEIYNFMKENSHIYTQLGPEPIYEINNHFFYLKIKPNEPVS